MPENRLSDKLLQLPLFMGMSKADLDDIMGYTKFGFEKIEGGVNIVEEGEVCNRLYILTNGYMNATTTSDDHSYSIREELHSPYLFQPERLFGMQQRFTHRFDALTTCNLITLSKDETMRLLEQFLVFRLNFYNTLATQAQKLTKRAWRPAPKDLRAKIIRFFTDHCLYPAGKKLFTIKMNTIAQEVNDSRLDVSRVLNKIQDEGLLTLGRGKISIPAIEKLSN